MPKCDFPQERVKACEEAGIPRERLLIDPGLASEDRRAQSAPVGAARRVRAAGFAHIGRFITQVHDRKCASAGQRRASVTVSIALATLAAWQGAAIVRVHDVRATADARHMPGGAGTTTRRDDTAMNARKYFWHRRYPWPGRDA